MKLFPLIPYILLTFFLPTLLAQTFDITGINTNKIYTIQKTKLIFTITQTDAPNFALLDKTQIQLAYTAADKTTQDLTMLVVSVSSTNIIAEILVIDNTVFANSNFVKIYKSEDGGTGWTEQTGLTLEYVLKPTITSATPGELIQNVGQSIAIVGTDFKTPLDTSKMKCLFDDFLTEITSIADSSNLVCEKPTFAKSYSNVQISFQEGETLVHQLTNIARPLLSEVIPRYGTQDGQDSVILKGDFTDLIAAGTVFDVYFGGQVATVTNSQNAQLTLTTPTGTGTVDILLKLQATSEQISRNYIQFTYIQLPTSTDINTISPSVVLKRSTGDLSVGISIKLTSALLDQRVAYLCKIGSSGTILQSLQMSTTHLICEDSGANTAGNFDVYLGITSANMKLITSSQPFAVIDNSLASISPTQIFPSFDVNIQLTGVFSNGLNYYSFIEDVKSELCLYVSPTKVTCKFQNLKILSDIVQAKDFSLFYEESASSYMFIGSQTITVLHYPIIIDYSQKYIASALLATDTTVVTLTGFNFPATPSLLKACILDLTVCSGDFAATVNANEYQFSIQNILLGTTLIEKLYLVSSTSNHLLDNKVSFYIKSSATMTITTLQPSVLYRKSLQRFIKLIGTNMFFPNLGLSLWCNFQLTNNLVAYYKSSTEMFCRIPQATAVFSGYPELSIGGNSSLLFTLSEVPNFKATNQYNDNFYSLLPQTSQITLPTGFLTGTNLPSTNQAIQCLWKDLNNNVYFSEYSQSTSTSATCKIPLQLVSTTPVSLTSTEPYVLPTYLTVQLFLQDDYLLGSIANVFYTSYFIKGYYDNSGQLTECSIGNYCPALSSGEMACAIGYYQGRTGQASCQRCQEGFLCDSSGQTTTKPCPANKLCSNYAFASRLAQKAPPGFTIQDLTQTPFLQESFPYASYQNVLCPAGNYCVNNVTSSVTQGTKIMVIPLGSSQSPAAGLCPKGFTCSATSQPLPCKARHYCPQGLALGADIPCKKGTYNPNKGQEKCLSCPIGFVCPEEGMFMPKKCPKQYVCPTRGLIVPELPCPAGMICEGQQKIMFVEAPCMAAKDGESCSDSEIGYDESDNVVTTTVITKPAKCC